MTDFQDFVNETGPVQRIDVDQGRVVVKLLNDIDMDCSPEVRTVLMELTAKQIPVIGIDLSEVPYMDSSGLATLVEAMQRVKKYKGELILFGLQQRVRSVFEIAKLTSIFTIRADWGKDS